jgi:hypothetical protein
MRNRSKLAARRRPRGARRLRQFEALRPTTPDELHRFVAAAFGLRVPRRAMVAGNDAPFEYLTHVFFEGQAPSPLSERDGARGKGPQALGDPSESGMCEDLGAGASAGEAGLRRDVGAICAHPHPASAPRTSPGGRGGGDVVVWANRGGGKTMLGAVATMLDLLFKPGVQVRILGGSFEQSDKMYQYLLALLDRPAFRALVLTEPTQRRVALVNGSGVHVLNQSERSVRGQRVHKMRCDEVEEFEAEVWEAAQFVTRSQVLAGLPVRGAVEALSTMHRAHGLMNRLTAPAEGRHGPGPRGTPRVLRWSAIDVIERCPPDRPCEGCVLWNDCLGRAKDADGFMKVDDVVDQWHRTSDRRWASEMMCLRPSREDCVYANFDPTPGGPHVKAALPGGGGDSELVTGMRAECHRIIEEKSARLSLSASGSLEPDAAIDRDKIDKWKRLKAQGRHREAMLVCGMDLGMRSPLVMLWARVHPPSPPPPEGEGGDWDARPEHFRVQVIGEYWAQGLTLERHLDCIERLGWPKPAWLGVDPAGGQRNSQTGRSDLQVLRSRGYKVRAKRSGIDAGVEMIRRRLDRGTLVIDASCTRLIRDLSEYHFSTKKPNDDRPVKDGPDHACDALRYLIVNLELGPRRVEVKRYRG